MDIASELEMIRGCQQDYAKEQVKFGKPARPFSNRRVFNEGTMLRRMIEHWRFAPTDERFPFLPFPQSAKEYFSRGQLFTPFTKVSRADHSSVETNSRADGIIGDFYIEGKAGIRLLPGFRYFSVFEAKISAPLSDVKYGGYNQVSRTAACMINSILKAGEHCNNSVQLVILYSKNNQHITESSISLSHIEQEIEKRIVRYKRDHLGNAEFRLFESRWRDTLKQLEVNSYTWEFVLESSPNNNLRAFYSLCKKFS